MNKQLEAVFLEAIELHQQKLLRVCSVYAEDEDDKKDLFQEALIQIWKSMPAFEGRSSISTWMFRITLNVCLRFQSKELKRHKFFINVEHAHLTQIANPDDDFSDKQNHLFKLRSCIKKLNDADKSIIALYLEELSYQEISTITGLKENTIAVKIKRIKHKLSTCITETL